MNRLLLSAGLIVAGLLLSPVAQAATITQWNMTDVVVDSAPYTPFETYHSDIYDGVATMQTYGGISWKEDDTVAPGLSIVNDDNVDGSNCIMCAGLNPYDQTIKQCSDPFQSSKRFKLFSTDNEPLVLTFDVVDADTNIYRVLQKYSNYSPTRWQGYTIELGFVDGQGQFVASTADDGLAFCTSKGVVYQTTTAASTVRDRDLSAQFSQGLFGAPDKNHPEPGYFNPAQRASFEMQVSEDLIASDGISTVYSDLFGQWLNEEALPTGIFWDDDGDVTTDNVLMANCEGTYDTVTGSCNGRWVTYRDYAGVIDGEAGAPVGVASEIPADVLADWAAQPDVYLVDVIDDLANLGLTYYIQLGDNSQWLTPQSFAIRFTPLAE
jgi:hypothetical protein